MAHNHRMKGISDPFLNARNAFLEQQAMLAQRTAGLRGVNYDPEESGYDEAYGPADRVSRAPAGGGVLTDPQRSFDDQEAAILERKVRGEN